VLLTIKSEHIALVSDPTAPSSGSIAITSAQPQSRCENHVRNKRLDVLRCVAILMVIGHHSNSFPILTKTGWVGVDLFFVLSGFLISGLLYSEFKKRQSISVGRFLVRRGLKIYPAFYTLLLLTLVAQLLLFKGAVPLKPYLYEILFIQNYHFGIWTHTWSLAVEEHFYIALALLFLILTRRSATKENPFRAIPWGFVSIAFACIALRVLTIWLTPPPVFRTPWVMNVTQCRVDGLFFGVFIGYLYHFRPDVIESLTRPRSNRIAIGILSAALLSTCYFFSRDDLFLLRYGLTFLYLGFGGLLVLSLEVRNVLSGNVANAASAIGSVCAFVGMYSYSIYLWHAVLIAATQVFLRKFPYITVPAGALFPFYLLGSIALGILFARLIEFPALRLRDRLFPKLRHPASTATTSLVSTTV
jgi:peptidoglycan/LPS O-acetylase OafA/YrhL